LAGAADFTGADFAGAGLAAAVFSAGAFAGARARAGACCPGGVPPLLFALPLIPVRQRHLRAAPRLESMTRTQQGVHQSGATTVE
jgi:hypothetical protein